MNSMFRRAILVVALSALSSHGWASFIDLNALTAFAPENVDIAAVGDSATLHEDPFGLTTLEHTGLPVPLGVESLQFDYLLNLPEGNEDFFDFFIGDLSVPEFSIGDFTEIGSAEFSGSHAVNVSQWQGQSVPIIFALQFGFVDFGLDATLRIINLQLGAPVRVSEPGSLWLLAAAGLLVVGRWRRRPLEAD